MKIQLISDLHLEFRANREWLIKNPIIPKGELLLIAGDTCCLERPEDADFFHQQIAKDFDHIISVMGNHEFYGSKIDFVYPSYIAKISDNHFCLNNDVFFYKDLKIIVSILWSYVPLYWAKTLENGLNDYHYIRRANPDGCARVIRVADTNEYHNNSVAFIEDELSKQFSGKTILLTHHLPSYSCISVDFKGSPLNAGFATRLDGLIERNPHLLYWFCGHSHDFSSINAHNTKVVRNPLGYVFRDEQHDFLRDFVVEV
jgi:hypothetical protein